MLNLHPRSATAGPQLPEHLNMTKRINQRQAVEAIRNHRDFKAAALSGVNDGPNQYIVLSYRTVIARFVEGEGWSLNERKYSPTTSRHQTIVRRATAGAALFRFEHAPPGARYRQDHSVSAALAKLAKVGSFATVADIPDAYVLVQGDEAREYGDHVGCAFVLDHEGERLHVLTINEAVPYLDAAVREAYRAPGIAD
jgi:hypothetical protein